MRPNYVIYTPKWDDEYPRSFHLGVVPPAPTGATMLWHNTVENSQCVQLGMISFHSVEMSSL